MSRSPRSRLGSVLELRRVQERQHRQSLAVALRRVEDALALVPDRPAALPLGPISATELARRRDRHELQWALRQSALGRATQAREAEQAARRAWSEKAADLRAVERLVERDRRRLRQEAARRHQRDLDEVALAQWRRRHG